MEGRGVGMMMREMMMKRVVVVQWVQGLSGIQGEKYGGDQRSSLH